MADFLSVWNELLKTIQTLTRWPLIVLYLVLLFRKTLAAQIPVLFQRVDALIDRLVSAKFKGVELDFQSLQELRASNPALGEAVTANLGTIQETDKTQTVDEFSAPEQFRPLRVSAERGSLDTEQQAIVSALSSLDYTWRTRERLLAATGLAPAQLDAALTQLLEDAVVKPAFSKNHSVIFGLSERVQGK